MEDLKDVKRLFDFIHHQRDFRPLDVSFADKREGSWKTRSTTEICELADAMSKGLLEKGIVPGDKIALISNNRSEWTIADIAMLQIGVITVPVYPTISESDFEYIFNHAEIKMVIVSDDELLAKVNAVNSAVPTLSSIYTFNKIEGASNWMELVEEGKKSTKEIAPLRDAVDGTKMATIIYTSGTTGRPKGVMLSHSNLISNVVDSIPRVPIVTGNVAVSFLPVCHVYERMLLYLYQAIGISVYYAESMETIGDDLRDVKPHVFTAVPRLLEKVYDKIMAKGNALTGIKKKLFFWACDVGDNYEIIGRSGWYNFKLKIARKLIFSKWQEALGGNCVAVASGSAALQPRLARVFIAAGIPIYEGYGLTETSPVVSVNYETDDNVRIGSVGPVLDNVTVKIAEDGEILVKGPNLMLGYYKQPDLTAEVIDQEGWFHTGDIGKFVEGKFLKITDRKKEIFKTSGGKYIAPQPMENKFKESRFIEQIMIVGENEKHPAALVVPTFDFVKAWAKKKGIDVGSNEEICSNADVRSRIKKEIDEFNEGFGSWEQIKKFEMLPAEWTVEGEELTPTLKLKRKVILKKYEEAYKRIYS